MNTRAFSFIAGREGPWAIESIREVVGTGLPVAPRLDIQPGMLKDAAAGAPWVLRGVTSNDRYVTRPEKEPLVAASPPLGRPTATCAALIPIRKSPAWWALTQDERRAVLEERSGHIAHGMRALPAVARRLHHCRDLGHAEPFDFLTWFEYAPADAHVFEQLVATLRATEEWKYVEREVDVRLIRDEPGQ